jgi:hypothetical protein
MVAQIITSGDKGIPVIVAQPAFRGTRHSPALIQTAFRSKTNDARTGRGMSFIDLHLPATGNLQFGNTIQEFIRFTGSVPA